MGIIQLPTPLPAQVGISPATKKMVTSDNLATVTAAGYLNSVNLEGYPVSPSDVLEVLYSYNLQSNSGTFGIFTVSITNGVITLVQWTDSGNVLLPVVSGNIAVFNGTTGQIADTGINSIAPVFLGNVQAGASGVAGTVSSFPATASKGSLVLAGVANTGNTKTTISNAAMGQASVISIPDPGGATANFVLDTGNASSGSFINLKYGATPVAQVDPASCTITAAAGAANTATVTVQLKDGSGTNLTRSVAFRVYSSSAADGLTLQSAASTGYSVASGGLSLANGTAVTTQISAMSSATGGCVLSLLDTGKQTSYLVLVLPSGNKISAQLSAGSYG